MRRLMTAGDAAKVLMVTPATVRNMADRGDLEVAARTEGGIHLFRTQDVEELAQKRADAERESEEEVS